MSVQKRIFQALAANAFGQAVTIATQLLLTPMYFRYWGASLYGEWLILSSIPAYLTMADVGIGSAAGNDMTMRAGAGDHPGAQQTFRSAMLIAMGAGLLALLIGSLFAWFWQMPQDAHVSRMQAQGVILLLSIHVGLGFAGGIFSAGFRAAGRNALGISLANAARLIEAIGLGLMLLNQQGPVAMCALMVGVRCVMLLIQHVWLRQICTWLFTPRVPADRTLLKRLLMPSLGFMAFPLGNALALQAPILIIGHALGAPAVAMFSAMRTLARVPVQVVNVLNSSIWPEMSLAQGARNTPLLRQLHRMSWGLTFFLILAAGTALTVLGPGIAHLWLGSKAPFDHNVLVALIFVVMLSAIWNVSSVVLAAINEHAELGLRYVVVNAACLAVAWMVSPSMGWTGLLPCLLLAEGLLLIWVLPKVLALTQDTLTLFVPDALRLGLQRLRAPLA